MRTASARVTQAEQQVINLERSVSARMRSAYAEWVASRSLVAASRQAVAANESALNGVRMENAVGTRTILEILNAEQELRDAQIQLANAERDHLVASMAILAALGKAKAGIIQFDQSPVLQPEGTLQDSLPRPAFSSLMDSVSTAPRRSDPNLPPPSSQTSIPDVPKVDSVPALQPAVSWAVQLGAFDSLQAARSQWQIVSEHLPYSRRNGFEAAVFRIEIGGRTLFRLAALGPSDWAQAQHACLTFKAAGQTCLVKKASLLGERIWSAPAAREN
ncbi:TolC family protein [Novosphingobium sp. MW5]|nr:TolC family protein [Novosphingobium sp. MW5]